MTWLAADEMGIELVRYRKSVGQSEAITRGRQVVMLMGCTQCAEFAHENYN